MFSDTVLNTVGDQDPLQIDDLIMEDHQNRIKEHLTIERTITFVVQKRGQH